MNTSHTRTAHAADEKEDLLYYYVGVAEERVRQTRPTLMDWSARKIIISREIDTNRYFAMRKCVAFQKLWSANLFGINLMLNRTHVCCEWPHDEYVFWLSVDLKHFPFQLTRASSNRLSHFCRSLGKRETAKSEWMKGDWNSHRFERPQMREKWLLSSICVAGFLYFSGCTSFRDKTANCSKSAREEF